MPSALFWFFEVVAEELCAEEARVLTRADLELDDNQAPLFDDLKRQMKAAETEQAIQLAVEALRGHFEGKNSALPFEYEPSTGRFRAIDKEYLHWVLNMSSMRSIGKRSRDFECSVADRLKVRATGELHRVGHPRDLRKRKADFNNHLKSLGFARPVLLGKDKDGGFDILWLLPIGTIPHRPIVSVQCKNGVFDINSAHQSVGTGSMSLSQHAGLQPSVHVPCVLFNDYIQPDMLSSKQLNFVPLGLSDLSSMHKSVSLQLI